MKALTAALVATLCAASTCAAAATFPKTCTLKPLGEGRDDTDQVSDAFFSVYAYR